MLHGFSVRRFASTLGLVTLISLFPQQSFAAYNSAWPQDIEPAQFLLVTAGIICLFLIRRSKAS